MNKKSIKSGMYRLLMFLVLALCLGGCETLGWRGSGLSTMDGRAFDLAH